MTAKQRQYLKDDPPTIGAGPAMLSASQKPIKVGDLLYVGSLDDETFDDDEVVKFQPQITAHRVFQVNYQYRWVRIRCSKGCEATIKFGVDGCDRTKYWHSLADARNDLSNRMMVRVRKAYLDLSRAQTAVRRAEMAKSATKQVRPKAIPAEV